MKMFLAIPFSCIFLSNSNWKRNNKNKADLAVLKNETKPIFVERKRLKLKQLVNMVAHIKLDSKFALLYVEITIKY